MQASLLEAEEKLQAHGGNCTHNTRPECLVDYIPHHCRAQALVLEAEEKLEAQGGNRRLQAAAATFYEVTIASIDQPKLLSRLSESLVRGAGSVPPNCAGWEACRLRVCRLCELLLRLGCVHVCYVQAWLCAARTWGAGWRDAQLGLRGQPGARARRGWGCAGWQCAG